MNWYIGQEIVAIESHKQGVFKKGDTFIIKGLKNSICTCKDVSIDIGKTSINHLTECQNCGVNWKNNGTWWFSEKRFAPLDYDISELTDILEKPIEHGVDKLRELANNYFETL